MLGSGGIATTAAGAAGAAAGMPWSIILPIAVSLLSGLFSKNPQDQEQEDLRRYMATLRQAGIRPPYQSGNVGTFDNIIAQALAANLGRYANFGFPEGMGVDLSFLQDYLANPSANRSLSGGLPGAVVRRG
jgi:hypothetical protein